MREKRTVDCEPAGRVSSRHHSKEATVRRMALMLAVVPLGFAPAPFLPSKPPSAEADLKALQGEWQLIRVGVKGRMRALAYELPPHTFDGDRFQTISVPGTCLWRVRLDPRKSPRQIDLVNTVGGAWPCIYRL